ncbi:unnamed protein product [Prorocentrum cordatum]|uniref:Uncharacterized protein n=1 Tax=Prorocentrum cordatum TaxID=2364126 RepID=A0ABN9XMH2_9DINO|nr:unnamed protein product [Polarella glacialis]
MREAKLEPDVISTYNAGVSACGKGGQWQRALALLSEMREAKLEPNGAHVFILQRWDQRVREGRAVAAGAGAAERDRALALLSDMWKAKVEPNSATTLGSAPARRADSGSRRWRC